MGENLVNDEGTRDEGNDSHGALAARAGERATGKESILKAVILFLYLRQKISLAH